MVNIKKVAIDLRMINSSGIGTYLQNIVPHIIENNNRIKFYLLCSQEEIEQYDWCNLNNVKIINFESPIYSINEQMNFLKFIPKDTDLLWSPHYNIPLLWRGKKLVTIHDTFHLTMKEFTKGLLKKVYSRLMFAGVARQSKKIISVSNFTKNEIVKHLHVDSTRIEVVHNGVGDEWNFREEKTTSSIPEKYIIYVGNVKPHKNLNNLVEAFLNIKEEIPHKLVIVGKKEGFITGDNQVIDQAEEYKDRIQFTGYLSKNELIKKVSEADFLVFPSLYEGFGLPPLEGMKAGCPTLVSNRASIPEVCEDATIYFDPTNVSELSKKIILMAEDTELKRELRVKGINQAKKFKWIKAANKTNELLNALLELEGNK